MNGEMNFHDPEGTHQAPEFDREAEKEKRKEIRKILTRQISDSTQDIGLKKSGSSVWHSEVGSKRHVLYLQRSQFSHLYYIEAGTCDIPAEKNVKPDITKCRKRQRIEYIVSHADFTREERESGNPEIKKMVHEREEAVRSLLNFEEPGAQERYPGEYFVPSVSIEESKQQIKEVGEIIKDYIPEWFVESQD